MKHPPSRLRISQNRPRLAEDCEIGLSFELLRKLNSNGEKSGRLQDMMEVEKEGWVKLSCLYVEIPLSDD
jgi:hypothetical protein